MTAKVTPDWLRAQGDVCAERAGRYVSGSPPMDEAYARLAREWFAAAAQAYKAAYELDVDP